MRSHDLQARDSGREDSRLRPPFRSLAKSSSLREKERYRSKESRVEKTESKWPRFDLSRHREAASTKGEKRTGAKDGFEEERAPFDRDLRYLPIRKPSS